MDSPNPFIRVVAAGLPLLVIALVFGGIGFALKQADQEPLAALPPVEIQSQGARGVIQGAGNGQIALVLEDGSTHSYQLPPNASIEVLRPASVADVKVGDWLNGGAIPHAQTLFALEGLVLIPDPVVAP